MIEQGIIKLFKFNVNLWTLCKKYPDPLSQCKNTRSLKRMYTFRVVVAKLWNSLTNLTRNVAWTFDLGLSEVMAGMGVEKLAKLMPDIIKTAEAPDIPPHVRDGYIMMFIYLPGTFGERFTEYVGKVIPAILKVGLVQHFRISIYKLTVSNNPFEKVCTMVN